MIPKRIEGATRYLGAPVGWEPELDGECAHLAIRDLALATGNVMVSVWEPTPGELAALIAGAPVILTMAGSEHPPVMIAVGLPPSVEGIR